MKYALLGFGAALLGSFVGGAAVWTYFVYRDVSPPPGKIYGLTAREFVLLDPHSKPAARLGFVDGNAALQFYNPDSSVALQIGIDREHDVRFLDYFDSHGQILTGLSTARGESDLFLGNWNGGPRIT